MPQDLYLDRYAYPKNFIKENPHNRLGISVVIPCYNEPNLIGSLDSLRDAMPPLCGVEVIVVINQPVKAEEAVHQQNLKTLLDTEAWKREWDRPDWKVHVIYAKDLPRKHAGVGMARKIGMDEAYRRFALLDSTDAGVIACFDADSLCRDDYLTALEAHFTRYPDTPACSIHYEHPLLGPESEALYRGIAGYELHLRYYVDALRWAGYPYAYQTIGSSMAVRARDYARVQGMNRRKAGEDFYFLHKLIPLGGFTELTYTQVIPSPRLSDRVPFGTGKAMHDWLRHPEGEYLTYDPAIFETLPGFLTALLEAKTTEADWQDLLPLLHPVLQTWLAEEGFLEAWQEAKTQSKSPEAYRQRILRWLDGFRILKYVHHARDEGWPMVSVQKAATWLLKDWGITKEDLPVQEQLHLFRHKDRSGWKHSLY